MHTFGVPVRVGFYLGFDQECLKWNQWVDMHNTTIVFPYQC
jgi:hypothetical protein